MSQNGSIEMHLISLLIQHIDKNVIRFVPEDTYYCLMLDGHALRYGFIWLEYCQKDKCEVVQLPSNTSHLLQPCYPKGNKELKRTV